MIRIKIKSLKLIPFIIQIKDKKSSKVPAFLALTIPMMCVATLIFIKMFSLMCLVTLDQRHQMEDMQCMEKIKTGILNYMKSQGTLPPITENGEINYQYHINHYIPPNYRLDHKKRPFKLTIYNKKFINRDLNGELLGWNSKNDWVKEPKDINLICVISKEGAGSQRTIDNQKVTIYFGDLENANINMNGKCYDSVPKNTNNSGDLANVKNLFMKKE